MSTNRRAQKNTNIKAKVELKTFKIQKNKNAVNKK